MILTDRARCKLGLRASAWVDAHAHPAVDVMGGQGGQALMVADGEGILSGVEKTLSRLFGPPQTIDRGEVAYWWIGGDHLRDDEDES